MRASLFPHLKHKFFFIALLLAAVFLLSESLYRFFHQPGIDDPYLHQPWAGPTLDPPVFSLAELPDPQIEDALVLDYQRKDFPASHRLETSLFVHFYPGPKTGEKYPVSRLSFIQIFRLDGGPWHVDENPDGSRHATFNSQHRGAYPLFPRQYERGHGIWLYDRPGHGPDRAPEVRIAWQLTFPWLTRRLIYLVQSHAFAQDFESVAVGWAGDHYDCLGSITWGQRFVDDRRVDDYFGPLHHPTADRGSTGALSYRPPSADFFAALLRDAPGTLIKISDGTPSVKNLTSF